MDERRPTYEELEELAWLGASLMAACQYAERNAADGRMVIGHCLELQHRYLAYLEKRLGDGNLERYAGDAQTIGARVAAKLGLPIVTIRWGA